VIYKLFEAITIQRWFPLIALSLGMLGISVHCKAEEAIHGGGATAAWKEGRQCGMEPVQHCFRFVQRAVGTPFFPPDCYRQQIYTIEITDVPNNISSFRILINESNITRAGVKQVLFNIDGRLVTINTFLVQNHGGPNNSCIGIGGEASIELMLASLN
jgi:hypothetical protein